MEAIAITASNSPPNIYLTQISEEKLILKANMRRIGARGIASPIFSMAYGEAEMFFKLPASKARDMADWLKSYAEWAENHGST